MTIDDTIRDRIVTALRAADRNARNPEDRREARELVYLLTVAPVVAAAEPVETQTAAVGADPSDVLTAEGKAEKAKRGK